MLTDRARHGIVRFEGPTCSGSSSSSLGVAYHERTVGKLLKALGFSHVSARPRHPAQDTRTIEGSKSVWPTPSANGVFEVI
jgi:hypothetical protein